MLRNICLPLIIAVLLVSPITQAATYALKFFDSSNSLIGRGQFTTDPLRQLCVETSPGGLCENQDGVDVIDIRNPLTSFSANIDIATWDLEEAAGMTMWWIAPNQRPGQQVQAAKLPVSVVYDEYFFHVLETNQVFQKALRMQILHADKLSGNGTWQQFYHPRDIPDTSASGTWTASVVPIPASLWLFMSGIAFLWRRALPKATA